MDRLIGAHETLASVRRLSGMTPPEAAFDAAFTQRSDRGVR